MKVGIIADIHSNLEALEATLRKLEKAKPDRIICLGDVVGYGADPNLCCKLVKENCEVVLIGNHDAAVVGTTSLDDFVEHAKDVCLWTREKISEENFEWLKSLPYTFEDEKYMFCHGAPYSPEDFIYVVDQISAFHSLKFIKSKDKKACFVGHAHITYTFWLEGQIVYAEVAQYLKVSRNYIVNVGSVGQPRDGDPKASWAILDTETDEYNLFRVEYNVDRASEKILEAGLPEILAQRLFWGR